VKTKKKKKTKGSAGAADVKAEPQATPGEVPEIPITDIIYNEKLLVRGTVDPEDPKFKDLVKSVKKHGVLQPVILRKVKAGHELLMGRQRIEAAKAAGLDTVPYVLRKGDDGKVFSMGLDENAARVDMSVIENAAALKRAMKLTKCKTNVELGKIIGRSARWIGAHLELNDLPPEIREALDENDGSVTVTKCHELMRVHPDDRPNMIRALKQLTLEPFKRYLEKEVKEERARWVGGKAAARPKKKKGDAAAEAAGKADASYPTEPAGKSDDEGMDVKTPVRIQAALRKAEKALAKEADKKDPDEAVAVYHRGRVHAYLDVLNLPEADSLEDALAAHEAGEKAAKKPAEKKAKKKKAPAKKKAAKKTTKKAKKPAKKKAKKKAKTKK